ncbi:hypothetical protein LCGC14_0409330 [marine sediment metagenome]|uniref:Uncharacterized protein n=1 Tax=marine sediment metagenome TaxID=412755 RepID=A0A0F9W3G5_9ZZZZ|nr:hypothetical protein [Phycisphaerae bacterium]HDZ44302.1 hypothetical protein [Phycisphaerae bacterium]
MIRQRARLWVLAVVMFAVVGTANGSGWGYFFKKGCWECGDPNLWSPQDTAVGASTPGGQTHDGDGNSGLAVRTARFEQATGLVQVGVTSDIIPDNAIKPVNIYGTTWGFPVPYLQIFLEDVNDAGEDEIVYRVVLRGDTYEEFDDATRGAGQSTYIAEKYGVELSLTLSEGGVYTYKITCVETGKIRRLKFAEHTAFVAEGEDATDGLYVATEYIDPDGRKFTISYGEDPDYDEPRVITYVRGGDGPSSQRATLTYVGSGTSIARISTGIYAVWRAAIWVEVVKFNFFGYVTGGPDAAHGSTGDLKFLVKQTLGQSPTDLEVTYYRYSASNGLEMVLTPAWYSRLAADPTGGAKTTFSAMETYIDSLSTEDVVSTSKGTTFKDYLDYRYVYSGGSVSAAYSKGNCGGATSRVLKETVTINLNDAIPGKMAGDDRNHWHTEYVVSYEDSEENVVKRITTFYNAFGQVMLRVVEQAQDGSHIGAAPVYRTGDFYQFFDGGKSYLHFENSAINWEAIDDAITGEFDTWQEVVKDDDGVNDPEFHDLMDQTGYPDFYEYIHTNSGICQLWAYATTTTATSSIRGNVRGGLDIQATYIGEGLASDPVYQQNFWYIENGTTGVYGLAQVETLTDMGGPSAGPYATLVAYAYVWYTDDYVDVVKRRTITRDVDEITAFSPHIGPGSNVLVSEEIYDIDGRLTWRTAESGEISYYEHNDLGQLTKQIDDADMTETDDFLDANEDLLPTGGGAWSTATGFGLHLITEYTYDDGGRVTEVLGPMHAVDTDGDGALEQAKTARWTVYIENDAFSLNERWSATGYKPATGNGDVVGPITVEKLCKLDRVLQTIVVPWANWTDTNEGETGRDYTLNAYDSVDTSDQADYLSWTVTWLDYDGLLGSRKVYHLILDTGEGASGTNYLETTYAYDELARVSKVTDPEGKNTFTFHTVVSQTIDSVAQTIIETRVYPHVDGSYQLAGPISVSWTAAAGDWTRQFLATATLSGTTPTGTESLTQLSRTTVTYDGQQRPDKTRVYFNLPANWDTGTSANYYESEVLAYDMAGRLLRRKDALGTITAQVYDGVGRVMERWVGTTTGDGTPANLRTDPGDGTSDLIAVEESYYDDNGSAADGNQVPELRERRRLDDTMGETWVSDTYNSHATAIVDVDLDDDGTDDGKFRVSRTEPADGPWRDQLSDGVVNWVSRTKDSSSPYYMLSMTTSLYEAGDRPFASRQYAVNPANGTIDANSEIDTTYAYDDAGRMNKVFMPSGGFTETVYDDAGRATNVIVWNDFGSPATTNDEAVVERIYTYDGVGNVTREALYRCDDDAYATTAGTGKRLTDASPPASQVSYVYRWYDHGHRLTTVANYGVLTSDPAPGSAPAQSGANDKIITAYAYDDAGRMETVTDNMGAVTKSYYDDLGRTTYVVENYLANNGTTYWTTDPSAPASRAGDECRVTAYTYNAAGQILTITALDPAADGNTTSDDQTTTYTYGACSTSAQKRKDYLLSIEYPDDSVNKVLFYYWRNAQPMIRTDQRGVSIAYTYDDAGKLTEETVGNYTGGDVDLTVKYIERDYDAAGRLELVTSKDISNTVLNQIKYVYDNYGNIDKEYQDHAGAVAGTEPYVQYSYDSSAGNRLEWVRYPNGRYVHYTYGDDDTITDRLAIVAGIYDDDGSTAGEYDGSDTAFAEYTYVGLGAIVKRTTPTAAVSGGLALMFGDSTNNYNGYDNLGRVAKIIWQNAAASATFDRFDYGYDGGGNRLYKKNAQGGTNADKHSELYHEESVAVGSEYDDLNRLLEFHRGQLATGERSIEAYDAGAQLFGLDQLGNWATFKDDATSGAAWDFEQTRTHNDVNELTDIGEEQGQDAWHEPVYDVWDDINDAGTGNGNMTFIPSPEYAWFGLGSGVHRVARYDAWNRLTERWQNLDNNKTFDDGTDRLAESFVYDGLNRRITAKMHDSVNPEALWVHRDYYYNTAWQELETRSFGDVDPIKQYIWCLRYIDTPIVRFYDTDAPPGPDGDYDDPNDSILYYTTDANFNVTALVRADTGRVAERYEYDPYGWPTILNGDPGTAQSAGDRDGTGVTEWAANMFQWSDWENLILFAGYRWDPFGTYYARNRYYHPTLATWITRDPGRWSQNMRRKRQKSRNVYDQYADGMNLYEYVGSNPLAYVDPQGTDRWVTGTVHLYVIYPVYDDQDRIKKYRKCQFYPKVDATTQAGVVGQTARNVAGSIFWSVPGEIECVTIAKSAITGTKHKTSCEADKKLHVFMNILEQTPPRFSWGHNCRSMVSIWVQYGVKSSKYEAWAAYDRKQADRYEAWAAHREKIGDKATAEWNRKQAKKYREQAEYNQAKAADDDMDWNRAAYGDHCPLWAAFHE